MTIPTQREELERKTVETLQKIVEDRESGRTTEAQYGYALDIVWSNVAGLVGNDVVAILEVTQGSVADGSEYTIEYFREPATRAIAKLINTHDGRVNAQIGRNDKWIDCRESSNPYRDAKQKFQMIRDKLVSIGYQRI